MRQVLTIMATLGGLSLTLGGTTALAGSCGVGVNPMYCQQPRIAPPPPAPCALPAPQMQAPLIAAPPAVQNCQTPVVVNHAAPAAVDPVVVGTTHPMGYLRSVHFSGSPHVNIMRVHGQANPVGLQDAPTGFTSGCNPSSTTYCGQQSAAAPVTAPSPMPMPQPYVAPPVAAPMIAAPAPIDPALRAPRQYGDTGMVRGTAYVPTSHVNRDYQTAVTVLNSGPIPARPAVNGGDVPHPSMFSGSGYGNSGYVAPVMAPQPRPIANSPVIAAPVAPSGVMPGQGYWEKVSGPTMVGNLPATQVICRRHAPTPPLPVVRPAPMPAPVTCVRQVMAPQPFMASGPAYSMRTSRYGSSH